jgi:hypothetical protein
MKNNFGIALLCQLSFALLFSLQTTAQSSSSFISATDQDLTIKNVTAVPFTDNIKGIYSKPLYKKFQELLAKDPLWAYEALPDSAQSLWTWMKIQQQ